jgi:hypothetical protein
MPLSPRSPSNLSHPQPHSVSPPAETTTHVRRRPLSVAHVILSVFHPRRSHGGRRGRPPLTRPRLVHIPHPLLLIPLLRRGQLLVGGPRVVRGNVRLRLGTQLNITRSHCQYSSITHRAGAFASCSRVRVLCSFGGRGGLYGKKEGEDMEQRAQQEESD